MAVPGERILGSYRLVERIGKGGMGEVYRAQHLRLGREAAVKILSPELVDEADFLARFDREAAAIASLDHPNILPVWDYGEAEGVPYLVMPLMRRSLKDQLANGPLPPREVAAYLRQMADALDYAHAQGIVHRDTKPANMLLNERGRLYLSDFGIAKGLSGGQGLTRAGMSVGTPEYMAPEQARGQAEPRSDLYSLGIVLYQMLTGRVPYGGTSVVEILIKHVQEPPPLLPLRNLAPPLPPAVEGVIHRSLAKNPSERYGSGRALADAFDAALTSGATPRPAPEVPSRGPAGGLAGEPTVQGFTPPPGGHMLPQYGPGPAQGATVAVPFGAGGNTPPPQYGQPFAPGGLGQTPPPGPYGQGAAPGYGPVSPPAVPQPLPQPRDRTPLLIGGLVGLLALLLVCIGVAALVAVNANGNGANGTATARAAATGTAGSVALVTGTAGALATATAAVPTATPRPPIAAPAPPTVTTAPVAVPTATTAPVPTATATPRPTPPPSPTPIATIAPTATAAPPPVTLTVAPASGPPGTVFRVTGAGLESYGSALPVSVLNAVGAETLTTPFAAPVSNGRIDFSLDTTGDPPGVYMVLLLGEGQRPVARGTITLTP